MIDAAGAIWRTEALRHDALAAKDAGVREDDIAVGVKVFVEGDPASAQRIPEAGSPAP
jgi:hypothetical protein